jgi:hypothetical protein
MSQGLSYYGEPTALWSAVFSRCRQHRRAPGCVRAATRQAQSHALGTATRRRARRRWRCLPRRVAAVVGCGRLSLPLGEREVMIDFCAARGSPPGRRFSCAGQDGGGTSFGTKGSQVQILPLRPTLSRNLDSQRHRLRHLFVQPVEPHLSGASDLSSESSCCIDE